MKWILLLLLAACAASPAATQQMVEEYVTTTPGLSEGNTTLISSDNLRCSGCRVFVFQQEIEENNSITSRMISIVTKGETIEQVIIDNEWDFLHQEPIHPETAVYYCATKPECKQTTVCSDRNKEFASTCDACADASTKWFVKSPCSQGVAQKAVSDLSEGKISKESATLLVLIAE